MKLLLVNILLLTMGCGNSHPEEIYLTKEFYDWTCADYQDYSKIVVSTNTCDDYETGLYWLVAESHISYGQGLKRKLDKTENWNTDCLWQTELPLIDDYCIEVEGVTLTAYAEPATWSSALSGN